MTFLMATMIDTEGLLRKATEELDAFGITSSRSVLSARRAASRRIERPGDLASFIEHTALKPETTRQAVVTLCEEAKRFGFRAVCVNPMFVGEAKRRLANSNCLTTTVVGFPLGANLTSTKIEETKAVIDNGADEVDMVIFVGALKSGDFKAAFTDIRRVVEAAGPVPVKVILEMVLLDEYQKILGCVMAERAGAAFVKTSTGFASGGATVEDVALMRKVVGERMAIKAAGGIRDFQTARALVMAGADSLGCSASVVIVTSP